jgi:hypothetical protein
MPAALRVDWEAVEKLAIAGVTYGELSQQFDVPETAVRKRSSRFKWLVPSAIHRRAAQLVASSPNAVTLVTRENLAAVAATDWNSRANAQREVAFKLAHESLKRMKPQAPKNFREAEVCDKMARRSAGLENADVVHQSLIMINDQIEAFDATPIEATLLPDSPLEITG